MRKESKLRALIRHPLKSEKRQKFLENISTLESITSSSIDLPRSQAVPESLLARCAIHIHGFYPDLIGEIISLLGPLTAKNVHIEVTLCDRDFINYTYGMLTAKQCKSANVSVVPNIGRDLGPLFTACRHLFENFQFVAHVHTKKSSHLPFGDAWRRYLTENVIGSDDQVSRQVAFLEANSRCAILYPENFEPIRKSTLTTSNSDVIEAILRRCDSGWSYEYKDFPAGAMFWIRSAAILPFFPSLPPLDAYEPEQGQLDGTIAHALERCLTLLPLKLGYDTVAYRPLKT